MDWRTASGWSAKPGGAETFTYGPRMATVYQCDMHRVLELDLDHREYTVTELDDDGMPATGDGERTASQARRTGGVVHIVVDVRETGDVREQFGHVARRYVITRRQVPEAGACALPQESVTDGWYIDLDQPQGDCRTHANEPTAQAVLVAADCDDRFVFEHTGAPLPRFAVEQTTTVQSAVPGAVRKRKSSGQSSTVRVTELSEAPLDTALFELPTGFKHVDKLDTMPSPPLMYRARVAWEGVKRTVKGWWPW